MGYNDKGHKEPLMVGEAGERPVKSMLTSPVCALPECSPFWRASARLAYTCSNKAHTAPCAGECPHALAMSVSTIQLREDRHESVCIELGGACYIGSKAASSHFLVGSTAGPPPRSSMVA